MDNEIMETHNEILVSFVRWFSFLFPSAHKPTTRQHFRFNLRKVDLYHHSFFSCVYVANLRHPVSWPSNLEEDFALDITLCGGNHQLGVLGVASRSACKIRLMFFPLRVGQVGAFIRM